MSTSFPPCFPSQRLTGGARPVFSPSGSKELPEPEFPMKPALLTAAGHARRR
jgi:hypothetical protein